MRKAVLILAVALLMVGLLAVPVMASQGVSGNAAKSLGKTTLDTTVNWTLGTGQIDGEFITSEVQGVVIGLRAKERFHGPYIVTGTNGNRVGVYEAATRTPDEGADNLATWNYDMYVNVSATGHDLSEYKLVLEQDFTGQSLYGLLGFNPVVIPLTGSIWQESWNPGFGNDDFNPSVEGTYHLRLVLVPETFNGPPLAVAIQVNVTS